MIARLTTYPYEFFRTSLTPEQELLSFLIYSLGLFFPLFWGLLFTGVVSFFFGSGAGPRQLYTILCPYRSSPPPISLLAFVAADLGHLVVIPLFSSPFSFLPFRHSISVRQSSFPFSLKTLFFLVLHLTVMPGADQSSRIRTGDNSEETSSCSFFYSTINVDW